MSGWSDRLHRVGVYFGVAEPNAQERDERSEHEAELAERSLGSLIAEGLVPAAVSGVLFAIVLLLLQGRAPTFTGVALPGGIVALLHGSVNLAYRLHGRRRGVARRTTPRLALEDVPPQHAPVIAALRGYPGPFMTVFRLDPELRVADVEDVMDFLRWECGLNWTQAEVTRALESVGGSRELMVDPWDVVLRWLARLAREPMSPKPAVFDMPEALFVELAPAETGNA